MTWQYPPYVLPVILAGMMSAALAFFAWRRRPSPGAATFALLMLAVAEWCLAYALSLSSADLSATLFWDKTEYLGTVTLAPAWLVFALQHTGRGKWLWRRNIAMLLIIPLITLALVWTNETHGLIYERTSLKAIGSFLALDAIYGPWFWVHIAYSYVLLLLGTLLFLRAFLHSPRLYRRQIIAVLVGMVVPWVANTLDIAGLGPFPYLDLAPFAFTVTGLAISWGLFSFRLLDIVPVARDALIEGMNDGVIVLDAQNRVVDLNAAARRIIGVPAQDAIGRPAEQVLSGLPDLVERYRQMTPAHAEIAWGEGEARRYYDPLLSPLRDRRGRLVGWLTVLRDITERIRTEKVQRQAEEALRLSEERYRTLVEAAQDVIFTVAADGTLTSLNPAFETLTGYSRADWLGRPFADLVHAEDLLLAQGVLEQILQGAVPPPFLLRLPSPTKGERVGELVITPQTKGKEITGVLGIARDVTDRQQAEEALRRSEEKYRALIENLNEVIFAVDTRGCFTYISPRIEQVAGYTADQVIGQNFSRFIHPDDLPGLVDRFQQTLEGRLHPYEFRVLTQDQQVRYVYTSSHPVLEEGQVVGLSGVMTDLTDRKQAEQALCESEERFRALYEDNPSMYFTVDAKGTVLSVNPFGAEQLGYTVEELVGQSVLKVFYEAEQAAVTEQLKVCLQHPGQVYRWQFRKVRRDGSLLWVEEFARAVGTPGGAQVLVVCNDITERKQAEAEIRRHSQRLATLNEIGQAITSTLDLDRVLALLLEQVRQFTDAEACSVALVEAGASDPSTGSGQALAFRQSVGEGRQAVMGLRLGPGQGIAGWVAQHRQSALVFDAASDPRFARHIDQITGFVTRDIVCVPLVARDQVTGVIELLNRRQGTFGEEDVTLLEAVAVEASVAIENARLFEETRRQLEEMAIVSQVALMGAAGRPFDEAISHAVDALRGLWPDSRVSFLFVDDALQSLRLHPASRGVPAEHIANFRVPLDQGITGWVARERQPVRVGDVTQDPRYFAGMPGTRSEMAAPLLVGEKVAGVINMECPWPNAYSGDDLRVLAALSSQLATIFEKARLDVALAEERAQLSRRVEERTAQLNLANMELLKAARAKDEFLASMSHELRTPLNAILGISEALQEQVFGLLNEKQLRYLHIIVESGQHLLALINDILDLAKIEAGKVELQMGTVVVELVCQASLRLVKEAAHKKRLKVSSSLDSKASTLQADERRLKQILVNLLGNAVKFTPEGGEVGLQVRGDVERQVVHFIVWDTGIGIAPENIGQLFQPFVQLDSGLSRQYPGTGLGLSLVKRLAELHGGSVSAESEGVPGKGSRFTVSLPWREAQPDKEARKYRDSEKNHAVTLSSYTPVTILLAEDSETTLAILSDYLSGKGYRVIVARNGIEAICRAREDRPAVILMDIQMPGMDGLEAIRRIRADPAPGMATIPIVALTALAMSGDREQCLEAGANGYVSKPVSLPELVETIEAQRSW